MRELIEEFTQYYAPEPERTEGERKEERRSVAMGRSLRALRIENGMTQYDLAALCKVSKTYIGNIETGCVKPTDQMWANIYGALRGAKHSK